MYRVITLTFVLLLSSCASSPGGSPAVKKVPPLAQVPGRGVTFTIPKESGWFLFNPDGKGATIMKSGKTEIESYGISLDFYRLPIPETALDFKEGYDKLTRAETSPPRYKLLAIEDNINEVDNRFNINFYYQVEDHQAVKIPLGDKFMLLEAMGLLAVHPSIPDYIVRISYSHRYSIGHGDPKFKEKAKWVIDNVVFTNQ